ncbi:hypothetical protein ACHMW5_20020 (plasmid) [Azospirillum melinis]|uniref:hypothetical protein n=1 Tax=Azospirillum melinis TaxID=328839 RepID=UPI0037584CDA
MVGRLHHPLQPLAAMLDGGDVLVGAQCGDHRSVELLRRQFALRLVIVDVVGVDHLPFGRLPGLAGAQDDADLPVAHLLADVADQLQPGIVGLHHHVQQDGGDARMLGQQRPRLPCGVGGQEADRPLLEHHLAQHDAGDGVDLVVVIDNQDRPGWIAPPAVGGPLRFGGEFQNIPGGVPPESVRPVGPFAPVDHHRPRGSIRLGRRQKITGACITPFADNFR